MTQTTTPPPASATPPPPAARVRARGRPPSRPQRPLGPLRRARHRAAGRADRMVLPALVAWHGRRAVPLHRSVADRGDADRRGRLGGPPVHRPAGARAAGAAGGAGAVDRTPGHGRAAPPVRLPPGLERGPRRRRRGAALRVAGLGRPLRVPLPAAGQRDRHPARGRPPGVRHAPRGARRTAAAAGDHDLRECAAQPGRLGGLPAHGLRLAGPDGDPGDRPRQLVGPRPGGPPPADRGRRARRPDRGHLRPGGRGALERPVLRGTHVRQLRPERRQQLDQREQPDARPAPQPRAGRGHPAGLREDRRLGAVVPPDDGARRLHRLQLAAHRPRLRQHQRDRRAAAAAAGADLERAGGQPQLADPRVRVVRQPVAAAPLPDRQARRRRQVALRPGDPRRDRGGQHQRLRPHLQRDGALTAHRQHSTARGGGTAGLAPRPDDGPAERPPRGLPAHRARGHQGGEERLRPRGHAAGLVPHARVASSTACDRPPAPVRRPCRSSSPPTGSATASSSPPRWP